ncbi:MAG: porin [Ramlibacter sp.]
MKNTVLAAAALATVLPLGAHAQSSVTLYGRLNIGVENYQFDSTPTRAGSRLTVMNSDASLWGVRGSEDLGGGLRALFKMEAGFQADSGAVTSATQFFSRESFVGLSSASAGTLLLGSQWAPGLWQSLRADPFTRFGPGGQPYITQGVRGYTLRYDNAIQYITPNFSGLSGRVIYAFGEGQPTGKGVAASVDYSKGPLYLGAFHEQGRTAAASVGLTGAAVTSKTTSVAATYDFGAVKLHGQYQRNRVERVASNVSAYLVGVTVPAGPGKIKASYIHRDAVNADAKVFGVGYEYPLSKRTQLLATVAKLKNQGTAAFRVGPALAEQGALGAAGPGPGQGATAINFAIMHSF